MKAYEEVIDFIGAGFAPAQLIAFQPSSAVNERVAELILREKETSISPEERSELDHYLQLEHLIRMAKARAHHYNAHDPGSK